MLFVEDQVRKVLLIGHYLHDLSNLCLSQCRWTPISAAMSEEGGWAKIRLIARYHWERFAGRTTHLLFLCPIYVSRARVRLHLIVVTFACDALGCFLNLVLHSSLGPSCRGDVVSVAVSVAVKLPDVFHRDAYVCYDCLRGPLFHSHLRIADVSCFDVSRAPLCRCHRRDVVSYDRNGGGGGLLPDFPRLHDDVSYDGDTFCLLKHRPYDVVTFSGHATNSSYDLCLQNASAFGGGLDLPSCTFLIAANLYLSHLLEFLTSLGPQHSLSPAAQHCDCRCRG